MIECFNHHLIWRGITHDNSKFRPDEFKALAEEFFGKYAPKDRFITGSSSGSLAMMRSWGLHQKRNDHHWPYWRVYGYRPCDHDKQTCLPIPEKVLTEMVCDWLGAARAKRKDRESVIIWWEACKDRMQIHPTSKEWIEHNLERMVMQVVVMRCV